MKIINRTVWVLSGVSLLADVASEMLYPVMPLYLKEIGFSVLLIGVLEGAVNFIAALTKGYFGKCSDDAGVRVPFIKWGYALSAASKPLLAITAAPVWIFLVRAMDRLGKGVRTAARDALLSEQATPQTRARVFGFHRSMDTLGAAIGPCVALMLLWIFPNQYRTLFLIAFVPGVLSVALVYLVNEKGRATATGKRASFFSFFGYWKTASPDYKRLVIGLLAFALFNSADVFLLLKTREVTGSDTVTIGAYILYNIVFAIASYPLGALADRIGIRTVFTSGLLLFAVVYALFGTAQTTLLLFIGFFLYGIYAAATEGIAKAWISNLAPLQTGTAIGFYTSCESICALLASVIAGAVWSAFGSTAAFLSSAVAAFFVALYFLVSRIGTQHKYFVS